MYRSQAAGNFSCGKDSIYGVKVEIYITIPGINNAVGKNGLVKSIWMIEGKILRLITPYAG